MKRYLGDGVYAQFDGRIILTTEVGDGRATNTIYLEPEVCQALSEFITELHKEEKQ